MQPSKVSPISPSLFTPELKLDERVEEMRRIRHGKVQQALHDMELARMAQEAADRARHQARRNEDEARDRLRHCMEKNENIIVGDTLVTLNAQGGIDIKRVTVIRLI